MNEKVYIKLSYNKYNITDTVLDDLGGCISRELKPYFGMLLNVEFVDSHDSAGVEIFIMDRPKYAGHDDSIKQQVKDTISSKILKVEPEQIEIKINYSQLNPAFNPTAKSEIGQGTEHPPKQAPPIPENSVEKNNRGKSTSDEFDYIKLSQNYSAEEPRYSFDQVILPQKTLEQIEHAIGVLKVEQKVFDEWGLRSIIPTASSALSFYGPPGTGKSMAAEAIAQKLGKRILSATYADIESKFHGEGPKMVKAIFMAAERDDAVLFLDESDSLLSKRLTNVSDGSAQAINSMRSQLLISLERFKGIVIFATNLVVNYDKAFLSRLINIEFTMPTATERERIWWQHLKTDTVHVPLYSDVNIKQLAERYEFCGREIKSTVKSACIAVALDGRDAVSQEDFIKACDTTKEETLKVTTANDHTVSKKPTLSDEQKDTLISVVQKRIDSSENH